MTEQDIDAGKPEPQFSVLSVSQQWWHVCVILLCVQTLAWMGFVWWGERSNAEDYGELVETVVYGTSRAIPLFIVLSIVLVVLSEFIGGLIMVLARYLKHKFEKEAEARGLERGIERGLEQGIEQGLEQGIERGIEIGKERERDAWQTWYRKMKEAEAAGEPFHEPPPSMGNGSSREG